MTALGNQFPYPQFHLLSEGALLIELGSVADDACARRVQLVAQRLSHAGWAGVLDIIPAYVTVLVLFDPWQIPPADLQARLVGLCTALTSSEPEPGRVVEIPVIYGGESGPDLEDVAAYHHLTPADVVALHSSARYEVRFIGFSPGFPYLAGLPPQLVTPRLATPRTRTPAGSIAIGGDHTGVYPSETPGGWRVIGRTPLKLYDSNAERPVFLQAGDCVRFVPVETFQCWLS